VVDNAKAISNAISPLYGQRAAEQLLSLLSDHENGVRDYAVAVYTKNEAGKQSAITKLRQNADQIASFLNRANPANWPLATLQAVLTGHIGAHMGQVDAIAAGDWSKEADVWKSMVDNVTTIADALADGIVKQFPDRFLLVCVCCCHLH
jgi:hypothetical protein